MLCIVEKELVSRIKTPYKSIVRNNPAGEKGKILEQLFLKRSCASGQ